MTQDRASRRETNLLILIAVALIACSGEPRAREPALRSTSEISPASPLPPSRYPSPSRLVAIGDVHGDLDSFLRALRLAGAIDAVNHWSGGALWIVQVGDLLDRGDEEDEVLALVSRLEREAQAAGGRFIAIHGNHELMNAQGDFRYVTPDGFDDFASYARQAPPPLQRAEIPSRMLGRAVAFAPGGPVARQLAARNTVVVVGDTVFVHGGLDPALLERGIDAINREVRGFLLGEAPLPPALLGENSPVWHRDFALSGDEETCATLDAALSRAGARRMVIGHTVQRDGIESGCGGHVWRIDVGLARHYGGPIQVLEIAGDRIEVLAAER